MLLGAREHKTARREGADVKRAALWFAAIALVVVASGCSGGGGRASSSKASVTVMVCFPEEKSLPRSTQSVAVAVLDLSRQPIAGPVLVVRPLPGVGAGQQRSPDRTGFSGQWRDNDTNERTRTGTWRQWRVGDNTVAVQFDKLPPGPAIVRAEGYETRAGSGQCIAEAEQQVELRAAQTARVELMTDRLPVRMAIQGPTRVEREEKVVYTATFLDADGEAVLGGTATFSSANPEVLAVLPDGRAEGKKEGQCTVSCHGTCAGREFDASVTVTVFERQAVTAQVKAAADAQVEAVLERSGTTEDYILVPTGEQAEFEVHAYDADGHEIPYARITAASSDGKIARVVNVYRGTSGWRVVVEGEATGVAVVQVQARSGGGTATVTGTVISRDSDQQIIAQLQAAQGTDGALYSNGAHVELQDCFPIVMALRVFGSNLTDPVGFVTYMQDQLYVLASATVGGYRGRPGLGLNLWATAYGLALHELLGLTPLAGDAPANYCLQRQTATGAFLDENGYVDSWGQGIVCTALGNYELMGTGWTWGSASKYQAGQWLASQANPDGSYSIGEVLHTFWAVSGLNWSDTMPADMTRTWNFFNSCQQPDGHFTKRPSSGTWDWLHEWTGAAGLMHTSLRASGASCKLRYAWEFAEWLANNKPSRIELYARWALCWAMFTSRVGDPSRYQRAWHAAKGEWTQLR